MEKARRGESLACSSSSAQSAAVRVLGVLPLPELETATPFREQVLRVLSDRWVRLVIFVLACFFTSALYYGWQQYQRMLFKDGAYLWLCGDGERCKAQEDAIARLYSIAAGCEYASAAIGGMFLDHLGPRRSGLIGELQWAIGTLLLALSSEQFQAYIPAMVIIGFSVNIVCFPALTTVENFPEWQGLMVGIALAAQNAATGVPPVLWSIMQRTNCSLRTIWLGYLVCVWLPITLLYTAALPGARDFKDMLKLQKQQLTQSNHKDQHDHLPSEDQELVQRKASWREFAQSLQKPEVLLMSLFYATMMLIFAYYPTVVAYAVSDELSDFLAYAMPTQAVWALLVGVVCDMYRTAYTMVGMCVCVEVAFLLTILAGDAAFAQYLACALIVVAQCAIFEVKYTFVAEMFDPYNFGKLVGLFGVVGGCATFINIPIAQITNYRAVFAVYACVVPLCALLALYLGYRQRRYGTYKTIPETKAPVDAAVVAEGSNPNTPSTC